MLNNPQKGPVTCLSCDAFGSKLITGSADRSCCIWSIESNGTIKANPLQVLGFELFLDLFLLFF